ncbi:MAG: response regulator [Acidobacteria bacterium]|nr:response regulator [Acidobacteriota bacterium]
MTILLVEDNEMNRDMLSRRLERKGHSVLLALDGEQAIQMTREHQPAVVLMDMSLPVLDGWEATRRLKADAQTAHIPVVALTAHALPAERDRALEAGCIAFETKPIDFPKLLSVIDTVTK